MVARDGYLEKLKSVMWDGNIKVITGLRRSGKSTLLFELFDEYLTSNDAKSENILKIKLDMRKDFAYRNPIALCDYVEKIVTAKKDERCLLLVPSIENGA